MACVHRQRAVMISAIRRTAIRSHLSLSSRPARRPSPP
ncbi:hypothetical protein R2601_04153 [Salipiger bermudensis HTCC2601]|uniref:Uncharacterized protein n=1 Tax=Salipiger bermudensis (strain DSM 26914 / JCM 13377 / KCTC 12554 / HTCC2601) TaxID=314265 RepID=Q0FW15_SALBH|nr:hypothetical protein R2601_04153 [Salipiger bermudensis HTCC2601]